MTPRALSLKPLPPVTTTVLPCHGNRPSLGGRNLTAAGCYDESSQGGRHIPNHAPTVASSVLHHDIPGDSDTSAPSSSSSTTLPKERFVAHLIAVKDAHIFCLQFVNCYALPIGATYRSWFVVLPPDKAPRVGYIPVHKSQWNSFYRTQPVPDAKKKSHRPA
jgi:hypothetical protein